MGKKYIVALDQGTTSSRAVVFDSDQKIVGVAQKEFTQIYPKEGWACFLSSKKREKKKLRNMGELVTRTK